MYMIFNHDMGVCMYSFPADSALRKEKDIAMYANKALSVQRWLFQPSIQGRTWGWFNRVAPS